MSTSVALLKSTQGRKRLRRRHGDGAMVTTRRPAEARRSAPERRSGGVGSSGGVGEVVTSRR
jgi:hypothetical protein